MNYSPTSQYLRGINTAYNTNCSTSRKILWVGNAAQQVEYLPSMPQALSSDHSITSVGLGWMMCTWSPSAWEVEAEQSSIQNVPPLLRLAWAIWVCVSEKKRTELKMKEKKKAKKEERIWWKKMKKKGRKNKISVNIYWK